MRCGVDAGFLNYIQDLEKRAETVRQGRKRRPALQRAD